MSDALTDALSKDELELLHRIAAETIEPCDPPAHVRARILDAVRRAPQLDESVPGEHECRTLRADEGTWKTIAPGARMKRLSKDAHRVTFLVDLEPFAIVEAHDHAGAETSYVVRGSCRIGALGLDTGDYHTVDAGAHHGDVVASAEGCLLLITLEVAA